MDYDGDGIDDMISGSYDPGEIYLFRGLGKGEYAARKTLVDREGRSVLLYPDQEDEVDSFGSWVAMVDWEADGDLDLILGGSDGEMLLRVNEGTRCEPTFAIDSVEILADGEPLVVPGQQATPMVADWDADGRWDLLSGSESGAAYWYRNEGSPEEPRFGGPRELVPPHVGSGYDEFLEIGDLPEPGIRSQIAAGPLP